MDVIGRLHIITDVSMQRRFSHVELARLALEGGAEVVQYRSKHAPARTALEEASGIQALCRRKGIPLIVNDRADVALFADAAGVHLGDEDLPIPLARGLLGPHRIIGSSADDAVQAAARAREGADYIGIGPVFATGSKADAGAVLGLPGLTRAVREVRDAEKGLALRIPLIAIGGITVENLPDVLATGVYGAAVLSAFCCAEDPIAAAAALRSAFDARGDGREDR